VPAAIGWLAWAVANRRRMLSRLAHPSLLPVLTATVDWARRRMRAGLIVAALLAIVVALAGPQWGAEWEDVKSRGADILIALDVSKSMLATDVKPNRLERAKLAIHELLPLLSGDRIGLVTFAGTSFLQCPLTVDYDAFAMTLDDASPDQIPKGGTAIGQGIRTAVKAFDAGTQGARVLVIVTDGEDHEGDPMAAAKEAAKAGVTIFAVGIGTQEGELIPVADDAGHQTFVKDREGRTVKSRLDESLLQRIAPETGGSYVRATATAFGLDVLYRDRIARLARGEGQSGKKQHAEERFQWPLAMALVLLMAELQVGDRRSPKAAVR